MKTKKRLIDADALIRLCQLVKGEEKHNKNCATALDLCIEVLKTAPTVDAVEVVRCKDCENWHKETGWCNHHSHFTKPDGEFCHPWENSDWKMFDEDDFCSYGERRKEKRR